MVIICNDEDLNDAIHYLEFVGKYKKLKSSATFHKYFKRVILIIKRSKDINELKINGALHYERLKYDLIGYSSVRIGFNTKFRLILKERENGIEIEAIEISEHYGDK